ncbi:hypothetical protein B0A50_04510 [Salinomyces thailandicus]|uniref:DASH complex subunit DAD2 n=1 Tax=Salinomyces thailandicus TaxID=706561 RepID=A0A4U0TXI4_9PEZI|nr:hypothetical protein B0A50_04510 [Salinomyces thailandica]
MSHPRPTALPSHLSRPSSTFNTSANAPTSALQARINEKKVELESLRQLRDLSGGLAGQMQQLEEKLGTLSNGTEAVAAVMGNWGNVLRAVYMASSKIPKPRDEGEESDQGKGPQLPQTLVRIPVQQAEAAQRVQAEAEASGDAGD